jgi:hypothetical protein
LPQPPQWTGSEASTTQAAPQAVVPGTHWHWPLPQYWVGAQVRPQVPQLLVEDTRFSQVLPQVVNPAGHMRGIQREPAQVSPGRQD